MFVLKDEKQIERAIQKARQIKPKVKILGFGLYEVRGSNGGTYQVRCKRDKLGNKTVGCNCRAGAEGLICYHSAAALGAHLVLAEARQTAR